MAAQYWIGGFFIDLSRNQITQNQQTQTIPPKALAVLTYLAKNQGKVVSQDELLDNIWQDTIASPNTLQRSIAQLRKALGDEDKIYIKTHAKQGYSLESDVRWQDGNDATKTGNFQVNTASPVQLSETDTDTDTDTNRKATRPKITEPSRLGLKLFSMLMVIVILVLISIQYFTPEQASQLSIRELNSLTATDNKEFSGIYSPDGRYVVFHRYSNMFCVNSIWAKNIETQQEFLLTESMGTYGSHSFSQDGKKLVFVKTTNCDQPITQKKCFNLATLDFNLALAAPQTPSTLLECNNSEIRDPTWLSDNYIVLLQKTSARWKLIRYSISENTSKVIHSVSDGDLIDYDYSPTEELISLISIHKDDQFYIEILEPNGELLSSHRIIYPEEIAKFRRISPNFSPYKNQFIFSTGRQLFTLSNKGQINNISLPLDEPMGSPIFHPDGTRMLVIKGHYDGDIAKVPLSEIRHTQAENAQNTQDMNHTVVERSRLDEESATFQPNGEHIAFISTRSGVEQLWLTSETGARQLTHFPMDTYTFGLDWAADGKSILINAHHELSQVFLDGSEKSHVFEHAIHRLFQWDSENQTALSLARINGVVRFANLDLAHSSINVINDKKVTWAFKSENDELIYTDKMDRFWRPGPAEDQLIEALNDQGSDKRFIIKNNVIYGVNEKFQLWSFDLNENTFEIIGDVPRNIDYITDINETDVLITIRISAKKEVAELILNK